MNQCTKGHLSLSLNKICCHGNNCHYMKPAERQEKRRGEEIEMSLVWTLTSQKTLTFPGGLAKPSIVLSEAAQPPPALSPINPSLDNH